MGRDEPRTSLIRLRDGRRLAFAEWGDPHGLPVIQHHGTPGSRLEHEGEPDVYRAACVRVITPDRPCCGLSDPLAGRAPRLAGRRGRARRRPRPAPPRLLASAIPRVDLRVCPGEGHMVMWNHLAKVLVAAAGRAFRPCSTERSSPKLALEV